MSKELPRNAQEKICVVDNVILRNGLNLSTVNIHCITTGTPKLVDGKIVNAVLVLPPFGGTVEAIFHYWTGSDAQAIVEDGPIDTSNNFVIVADALGLGAKSSKPSTQAELKDYCAEDIADVAVRVVQEHFPIEQLALITGVSLGAQLCYVIASQYPTFTRAIAPIAGTLCIKDDITGNYGGAYERFGWMLEQVKTVDPVSCRELVDDKQNTNVLIAVRNVIAKLVFSNEDYDQLLEQQQAFADNIVKHIHVTDLYYRLVMMMNYNALANLEDIQADIIIGYVENDNTASVENVRIMEAMHNGCRSFSANLANGHAGAVIGPNLSPEFAAAIKDYLTPEL